MARPIPYSVAFLDSTGNEWTPDHGFRGAELASLARASSGTLFDFSGARLDDPLLAVSSNISGLVSDRMAGFAFVVGPNAVPPDPIPEPGSLLVMLGAGILGLAGARVYYCRRVRRLD